MSKSPANSEASDTPMEVVVLEEEEDNVSKEEPQNKKPEGSRKDLGKT